MSHCRVQFSAVIHTWRFIQLVQLFLRFIWISFRKPGKPLHLSSFLLLRLNRGKPPLELCYRIFVCHNPSPPHSFRAGAPALVPKIPRDTAQRQASGKYCLKYSSRPNRSPLRPIRPFLAPGPMAS